MGPRLGAEFLVAVGDLSSFDSADHWAAYAGLIPVAHDSGKRTGNLRRMHGGNKVLKRVFYQSPFVSLRARSLEPSTTGSGLRGNGITKRCWLRPGEE